QLAQEGVGHPVAGDRVAKEGAGDGARVYGQPRVGHRVARDLVRHGDAELVDAAVVERQGERGPLAVGPLRQNGLRSSPGSAISLGSMFQPSTTSLGSSPSVPGSG